jgi:Fe-S-cluster containining protein
VPTGQTTVTELLPIIQSLDGAIIGMAEKQAAESGLAISCKAGCGACCRQMVPLSIFEAQALSEWIRTLPEERQQELQGRFHRVLLALRESGMLKRLVEEDWFANNDSSLLMAIEYFRQGLACPFLENESCSIHPIRPLACREYLVTSPPENCQDPARNGVAGVGLPLKLSRALFRMGSELEHDPRGWLPLVFLFVWMKSNVDPGARFSGTGQEVLYQVIQHLTTLPPEPASSLS